MNETTTPAADRTAVAAPAATPVRRHHALRRVATVATAAALCAGGLAVAAPAAQAATSITFCFKWSTGAPYARQPVYQYNYSTGAYTAPRGTTNSAGCATWVTPTNVPVRVMAYAYLQNGPGYQIWKGYTPYYAPAGSSRYNLGTGIVSLYAAG